VTGQVHTSLVLLAGGSGVRFGSDKPKQFHMLGGRPVMAHALDRIKASKLFGSLVVVSNPNHIDESRAIVAAQGVSDAIFVAGGSSRLSSSRNGALAAQAAGAQKIVFHEAVRPFVSQRILSDSVSFLDRYDGIDVVMPTADTLVELVEEKDAISRIPDRSTLRRGQVPQGFWVDRYLASFIEGEDIDALRFTDDCGFYLARNPDARIGIVEGNSINLKITEPLDLFIAEQLLQSGATEFFSSGPARQIKERCYVVTGHLSGIGKVTADALQAAGANVVGISRSMGVDIRDQTAMDRFMMETAERHGGIDGVINSAGTLEVKNLMDMPDGDIKDLIDINFMGTVVTARAAYSHLAASKGHLVLVSSSSYSRGRSSYSVYSASKAAVVNFAQALAEEWTPEGICVNCVVPRRTDTPLRWKAFPDEDRSGLLKPEAVADKIVEILTTDMTGGLFHVR
jgi:ribitol-5-phosphate 2-dehydrogenase (NADP+) / D-ribitol-5-phosphate cytidylyltransferase